MRRDNRCRLIARDFHILEAMLAERCGRDDPLEPLLRKKLSTATVVLPHEIPADVATLYSRVRYRVDGRGAATRVLIHSAAHEVIGATLPITHPRGLALLGLGEGATSTLLGVDGKPETVQIEKILYQPQMAGRLVERRGAVAR